MPTALTHALRMKDWDVKEWLKTDIARQYGMCVAIRDMENMDPARIEVELAKDAKNAHWEVKLEVLKRKLRIFEQKTEAQLKVEWLRDDALAARRNQIRMMQFESERTGLVSALGQLKQVKASESSVILEKAVKLATEQIEMVLAQDYSGEPYMLPRYKTHLEWAHAQEAELIKEMHAALHIVTDFGLKGEERLTMYRRYVEEVDKVFANV